MLCRCGNSSYYGSTTVTAFCCGCSTFYCACITAVAVQLQLWLQPWLQLWLLRLWLFSLPLWLLLSLLSWKCGSVPLRLHGRVSEGLNHHFWRVSLEPARSTFEGSPSLLAILASRPAEIAYSDESFPTPCMIAQIYRSRWYHKRLGHD